MKSMNKNMRTIRAFKFHELLWVFCVLFSTTFVFLGSNKFKSEVQKSNRYGFNVNQDNTPDKLIQSSRPARLHSSLLEFELVEESEPTDDDTVAGDYPVSPTPFGHVVLKASFEIFGLSLQKRTLIPLFLLHHSWKIPLA